MLVLFCITLILHLMHCIILLLAHMWLFYTLDHVQAGLLSEIQEEQVQEDLVVHKRQVAQMLTLS
jgi:hypothetical protein